MTPVAKWLEDLRRRRRGLADAPRFPAADSLASIPEPWDWTGPKRALFVKACREMASFHARACPPIARIYERHGFDPGGLHTEADIERIPPIAVSAFKYFLLTSLPLARAEAGYASSGTRGATSRAYFDPQSQRRIDAMVRSLWTQRGLVDQRPTNYALFSCDPDQLAGIAVQEGFRSNRGFTPIADSFYAATRGGDGRFFLDEERAYARLSAYARLNKPVRILGIPALIWDFLREAEAKGPLPLPAGSAVITGGGWKGAESRAVPRESFVAAIVARWGIARENIIDYYGCVEHRLVYMQCRAHRFHVPAYSSVLVRDPETMRTLPDGQTGLLELVSPPNAMMPTLALLTMDLGFRYPDACRCGFRSPTFALSGRADGGGAREHSGCAARLDETVSRRGGFR